MMHQNSLTIFEISFRKRQIKFAMLYDGQRFQNVRLRRVH